MKIVCEKEKSSVYSFKYSLSGLKIKRFDCNLEWMLAICYYRGTLREYASNQMVSKIVAEIEAADVIIAPIADNKMFYVMAQFTDGEINADVALHLGEGGKAVGIGGYADTSNPNSITMWWNTIFKEGFEINSVGMKIGSNMTDLANVPNGVTSGRYLKFCGSNGGNDNYYLLISYTGKLYVGIQINGASTITWTEK